MSNIERSGGGPLPENHTDINPATGQQKAYIVLTPEERAKGFVEPVRTSYVHLTCGVSTKMSRDLAETYARDPEFYSGTFCAQCRVHLPLREFVWEGTQQVVGTRTPTVTPEERARAERAAVYEETLRGLTKLIRQTLDQPAPGERLALLLMDARDRLEETQRSSSGARSDEKETGKGST